MRAAQPVELALPVGEDARFEISDRGEAFIWLGLPEAAAMLLKRSPSSELRQVGCVGSRGGALLAADGQRVSAGEIDAIICRRPRPACGYPLEAFLRHPQPLFGEAVAGIFTSTGCEGSPQTGRSSDRNVPRRFLLGRPLCASADFEIQCASCTVGEYVAASLN
jgi:hypothetical protein